MLRVKAFVIIGTLLSALAWAGERSDDWTILPQSAAERMRRPCSRPFPKDLGEWWETSVSEVERAERKLPAAIDAALARLNRPEDRRLSRDRYHRQYAGFSRNGKHVLYVTAVAFRNVTAWQGEWRIGFIDICDGGTVAFGAVYDLDKDRFDTFFFNGHITGPLPGGGWSSLE